ncbi:MAG: NAD-dependent epimerase/dehydratase family protein, partial [Dehalococcoidales bacterium]|nr:NAD-dependent epimerase/dehydratase family protein [Dehalococcoidales bacterium]
MAVLVTGGGGYIGSVVAEELLARGREVIILDSLKKGYREAVPPGAKLLEADIQDTVALTEIFGGHSIEAVMHLAAESIVEASMADPAMTFQANVCGGLNLLAAMRQSGVSKLIFSSTAAVYGEPKAVPIREEHPLAPVNPYGESKLMFEKVLGWYGRAYGLRHISLRY